MDSIIDFSLLSPVGEYEYFTLSEYTSNDLSIDFIIENITSTSSERSILKKILMKMPICQSVIQYRQAIYKDLKNTPEICEELCEIFKEMQFYSSEKSRNIDNKSSIWDFISRLKELENYCLSVIKIKKILSGHSFQSEGMKKFSNFIDMIYNDGGFYELSEDIKSLGEDMSSIKSMTLGVNFNSDFFPDEVGIISMNEYYFHEQGVLERFIGFHKKRNSSDKNLNSFAMVTHPHKGSVSESPLMNNLSNIVERMLPDITHRLKRILKKYTDTSGLSLSRLADEFLFYERFIKLEHHISECGNPCCMVEFSNDDTLISDFYNIKLAVCRIKGTIGHSVVCNDLEFTNEKNIMILTGPNRGGKTIFTQGIGIAFLLFQQGVFVPCSKGKMRICDGIYTHFPADENKTISLGRLGEEAQRLSEICKTATSESLLLFNESFATTSHTESIYIATDILKYLCSLGVRACFNTHIHELAENADKLSLSDKSVCGAVSVVMGCENGERSYKIFYKKPDSKSYAHDIAYKYGITFEQLCKL